MRTRIRPSGCPPVVFPSLWWSRFLRVAVPRRLSLIPEDLTFDSGEAFSLEGVDNIPMEELFCGSHGDGSAAGSSDITSISLDTVLDLNLAS